MPVLDRNEDTSRWFEIALHGFENFGSLLDEASATAGSRSVGTFDGFTFVR